jgi:hypothetical protein
VWYVSERTTSLCQGYVSKNEGKKGVSLRNL